MFRGRKRAANGNGDGLHVFVIAPKICIVRKNIFCFGRQKQVAWLPVTAFEENDFRNNPFCRHNCYSIYRVAVVSNLRIFPKKKNAGMDCQRFDGKY